MVIHHTLAGHGAIAGVGQHENAANGDTSGTGGVGKRLDAATIACSPGFAEQVRQQVFDVLASGFELCAALSLDPSDAAPVATLSAACDVLAQAAADAGVSPRRVEILVDSPAVGPRDAAAVRRDTLGEGTVHVVADVNRLRGPYRRPGALSDSWRELWQASGGVRLQLAYAAPVRAASSLLRSEPATTVLPRSHIEVPAGTAWVQLRVNLPGLGGGSPFCSVALERALRHAVEHGERLHDEAAWATPAMRDDAWLNRRIAIAVDGIGDLVVNEGLDPSAFATLEFLDRLLHTAQEVVRDQSRAIARRAGHAPALDQTDPCRFLPRGAVRDAWRKRWDEMLVTAAVRHRNLLVISPWSVFPAGSPADFRYTDLLPVLRHADACMLSGAPDLRAWNANNFIEFHRRASAALQQRESRHQIAEGC
jgi:hypothetical protein